MAQQGLLRLVVNNDNPHMGGISDFEVWMRSWGASENTIRARVCVIGTATRGWGPDPTLVTSSLVTAWLANPGFSPWTRSAYYYHAKSYFRWLVETNQIANDPTATMKPPRTPKDKPRPLTQIETQLALSRASRHIRAWLLLGLLAGLRAHEIAKLRGIEMTEESIFVVGKGNTAAYVPTHPVLWQLAQDYPRAGWWFPSRSGARSPHVASTSITGMVTRHFAALGIEGSSHRCRHTFATNLLRSGVNIRVVQTLMRHESLATTAKYTGVDEPERAAAIRGLVA